jgi:hypothetical protein
VESLCKDLHGNSGLRIDLRHIRTGIDPTDSCGWHRTDSAKNRAKTLVSLQLHDSLWEAAVLLDASGRNLATAAAAQFPSTHLARIGKHKSLTTAIPSRSLNGVGAKPCMAKAMTS